MRTLNTIWTGIRQLVMHNGELANPLNRFSKAMKEISGKRKKTESDYEALSRLEFEGGLYWDDDAGPVIPSDCIEACIHPRHQYPTRSPIGIRTEKARVHLGAHGH